MLLLRLWNLLLSLFLIVIITNIFGCSSNTLIEYIESKDIVIAADISDEILKKLQSKSYKEVEQFFEHLVEKKPYSVNGTRLLEEIYTNLSNRRDLNEYVDAWYSSGGLHFSNIILEGLYLVKEAWRARGSDFGYTVTEDRSQLFRLNLMQAKQRFELANELNPDDPNSAAWMISVCMGLGLDETTMEGWFQRAIKADPVSFNSYSNKLTFLLPKWRGSREKSSRFADYCFRSAPEGSIAYTILFFYFEELAKKSISVKIFFEHNQVKEITDKIFSRWLKDFPNASLAYENLALLKFRTDDRFGALHNCNKVLKIEPTNSRILTLRAVIYMRYFSETKIEAAIDDFEKSIKIDPENAGTFYRYGYLSSTYLKDYEKAIHLFDRAILLNDKKKEYFMERGNAKTKLENFSSAIDDYSSAIALDPKYLSAYSLRSSCYREMNLDEKAEEDSKKVSELSVIYEKRFSIPAITPQIARKMVSGKSRVSLSRIKSIDAEVAKVLVTKRGWLDLSGLERITPEVAKILAERKGELNLSGLKSISLEIAECFSAHDGHLHLNGIEELNQGTAKLLSRNIGELSLGGLKSISTEVAMELSKLPKGGLSVDGLESITPEVARHLKQTKGWLALRGLKSITPEVAKHLGQTESTLNLKGLKTISAKEASYLAGCKKALVLSGLKEINPEIAKELMKHKGNLDLSGLRYISPDVAKFLGEHEGRLSLRGLKETEIDPKALAYLKNHKGKINLK